MTSAGVSICPSRNCEAADRFLWNLVWTLCYCKIL